jgi:hypothetical protein
MRIHRGLFDQSHLANHELDGVVTASEGEE